MKSPRNLSDYLGSEAMRRLNPDPYGLAKSSQQTCTKVSKKSDQEKPEKLSEGSTLEIKFLRLWAHLGGPALSREHRFHPTRKWRLDFYHAESNTAVEIDGGIWVKSGHSSGGGIMRDMEKGNELTFCGIHLFRLHDKSITEDNLKRIIAFTSHSGKEKQTPSP